MQIYFHYTRNKLSATIVQICCIFVIRLVDFAKIYQDNFSDTPGNHALYVSAATLDGHIREIFKVTLK